MPFVDVTNDVAFRKIFGSASQKSVLLSFLNAVIVLPNGELIEEVDILNPYQLGMLSDSKSTIVDVKATDRLGNHYIVEMQVAEYSFFHKRILYYTSQSYAGQIIKGSDYEQLRPVYFIGILEFEIGQSAGYFSKHHVLNVQTHERVVQDVEFNFIELPKFHKSADELTTPVDQWTFFIKNADRLEKIPESVDDKGLTDAYISASQYNWTRAEYDEYIRVGISERDKIGIMEVAVEKAEKRGEEKARRELISGLKAKGLSREAVAELFSLSPSEIEKYW